MAKEKTPKHQTHEKTSSRHTRKQAAETTDQRFGLNKLQVFVLSDIECNIPMCELDMKFKNQENRT